MLLNGNHLLSYRTTCRICGGDNLQTVVDLGAQFLSGIFVMNDAPKYLLQQYPLEVVRCAHKGGCGLVQLRHSVARSVLYYDYGYRSGLNEKMRINLAEIAHQAEQMVTLQKGDTVLDIGCNDGTLLNAYETLGIDCLGIDPAHNVAAMARENGLDVIDDFFNANVYTNARPNKKARIVTSIAMFYDLEDPQQFVRDVVSIMTDDGIWVIELSYLPFMLEKASYDTICHEHLEYYTLRQIEWMLYKEDLCVHKIEFNDINGGSFRLFIRKKCAGSVPVSEDTLLTRVRMEEQAMELATDHPYKIFNNNALRIRTDLRNLLMNLKKDRKRVYIYGASTKGNTILQFCGIDHTLIPKAADRNPKKWGCHTLGTDIPIISEEEARMDKPDYFLVLPWHFIDVFLQRERNFLERGGKFILPLPEVKVVGLEGL